MDKQKLSSTARAWVQTTVDFVFAQGIAQALGMATGLIFVRAMPVEEYAIYAIVMTALSLVAVGSDLGLNSSLGYFWRSELSKNKSISPKLSIILKLRIFLMLCSLVVGMAIVLSSSVVSSASGGAVLVIVLLMIIIACLQVHNSFGLALIRLQGFQRASYKCEVAGNFVRFAGAISLVLLSAVTVLFGIGIGVLGALTVWFLLRSVERRTDLGAGGAVPTKQDWMEVRSYLLPVMPSVLVYMAQDPIVIWFTSQNAGATAVAEVFALTRIAAILGIVGTFVTIVMSPRLARIADPNDFVRSFIAYFLALFVFVLAAATFMFSSPEYVLWLLGEKYCHLKLEGALVVCAASITILTSLIVVANRVRGWVRIDPAMSSIHLAILFFICINWNYENTLSVTQLLVLLSVCSFCVATTVSILGWLRPGFVTINSAKTSA